MTSHHSTSHHPNCRCSLCGCAYYDMFSFKKGFVCENCLEFLKDEYHPSDTY